MSSDIILEENDVIVDNAQHNAHLVVRGTDIILDSPERRGSNGDGLRCALVHNGGDQLVINFGGGYTGGIAMTGKVTVNGEATLVGSSTIHGSCLAERFIIRRSGAPDVFLDGVVADLEEKMIDLMPTPDTIRTKKISLFLKNHVGGPLAPGFTRQDLEPVITELQGQVKSLQQQVAALSAKIGL